MISTKSEGNQSFDTDPRNCDLLPHRAGDAIGKAWWRRDLDPGVGKPTYHGWYAVMKSVAPTESGMSATFEIDGGRSITVNYGDPSRMWSALPTTAGLVGQRGWLFLEEGTAYNAGLPPPPGKWPNSGGTIWDGMEAHFERLFSMKLESKR